MNKRGEEVELYHILFKRNRLMLKTYDSFKWNQRLARGGEAKRRQFNLEWDAFRLYDSDLILLFMDQAGKKVTLSEIKAARQSRMQQSPDDAAVPTTEAARSISYTSSRHLAWEELVVLMKRKQVKEHKLMVFREAHPEIQTEPDTEAVKRSGDDCTPRVPSSTTAAASTATVASASSRQPCSRGSCFSSFSDKHQPGHESTRGTAAFLNFRQI